MEWYEKFDFDENPFSSNPEENHDNLVNLDDAKEEMFYRINSGSMLVIEGAKGTGKTSLLMMAAKKFGGQKNVAYVDCRILDKNLNITHVLQDRYGLLGRLLNKKPMNMILLLDNVQALSKKNTERLKYYFDQNYLKSIIFTTESYKGAKFSDSLRDRIGKRVVKLPKVDEMTAIEIVRKRIGENEILNDDLIKKIFKSSDNSVKELLENCTKAAQAASKKNRKRVQEADLKVLQGDKNE